MIQEFNPAEMAPTRSAPIYLQVADSLRAKITSGAWPHDFRLPAEAELAKMLNINHQTLRKSLRILALENLLVRHHGVGTFVSYRPEPVRRRVGVIGVNPQTLGGDFYAWQVIAGLAGEKGNPEAVLSFIPMRDRTHSEILAAIHASGCDGFIVLDRDMAFSRLLCRAEFDQLPMVFVSTSDSFLEKSGKVCVDLTAEQIEPAVDYLYDLGFRRIAYVGGEGPQYHIGLRNSGFISRMQALELEVKPDWCHRSGSVSFQNGREWAVRFCAAADRPEAVICAGAPLAYGVWQGIMDLGLRIPEDISVVGFDCSDRYNPLISTVLQPIEDMASKALSLLEIQMVSGTPPQRIFHFEPFFVERGSCRKK